MNPLDYVPPPNEDDFEENFEGDHFNNPADEFIYQFAIAQFAAAQQNRNEPQRIRPPQT